MYRSGMTVTRFPKLVKSHFIRPSSTGAITAIGWTTTSTRRRRRILHVEPDYGSAVDFTVQPGMAGELEPAIAALTAGSPATGHQANSEQVDPG